MVPPDQRSYRMNQSPVTARCPFPGYEHDFTYTPRSRRGRPRTWCDEHLPLSRNLRAVKDADGQPTGEYEWVMEVYERTRSGSLAVMEVTDHLRLEPVPSWSDVAAMNRHLRRIWTRVQLDPDMAPVIYWRDPARRYAPELQEAHEFELRTRKPPGSSDSRPSHSCPHSAVRK